jgi:hypothetical protein
MESLCEIEQKKYHTFNVYITEKSILKNKLYFSCYSCMNMNIFCYHIKLTSTVTLQLCLFWSFYLSPLQLQEID